MKKILFLLIISIFILQSCSVNSEITYHKDSASTTITNIDMKEAMTMMKSMIPDSAKTDEKGFDELEKMPRTWTSLYEWEKQEGKLKTTNPDSIKIMKKIFMKSNFDKDELAGISMKMDHFTKEDYKTVGAMSRDEKLPIDQMAMNSWDGKTLIIDTEKLSLDGVKDILATKGVSGQVSETSLSTLKMMYKEIGTTLKFENKIKSISGKHDWITKADDYSKINYDLDYLFGEEKDKKPLKNADKKITVITE
ncbi:hypothetical protein [Chryseobacterium daeguense]|uniref:hypothetical protein n=1 Tax=Chryseobacterium daeguense TaxID=412438 RepID=UPI0004228266|nr:hypothetical protein [Chryseobacterium daeguense]